jgi:hypothetical protein
MNNLLIREKWKTEEDKSYTDRKGNFRKQVPN